FGATTYRFEYGPSELYGTATLFGESIGNDGGKHLVSTTITGLLPNTTYHFRARAVNFGGVGNGPDATFTTLGPPEVGSATVSQVTETTAAVSVPINPNQSPTTFRVEFASTAGGGGQTVESAPIGADDVPHFVTTTLTGLAPGTEYHFHVV